MEIVTFVKPSAANPYAEDIAGLLAAMENDPNAMGVFTVKNSNAITAKKQIADAASALNKTASFGKRTVREALETRYSVLLTPKHAARRNKAREEAAKAAENTVSIHDIIDEVSEKFAAEKHKATPKPRAKATPKDDIDPEDMVGRTMF